jgi:hypothetical protein
MSIFAQRSKLSEGWQTQIHHQLPYLTDHQIRVMRPYISGIFLDFGWLFLDLKQWMFGVAPTVRIEPQAARSKDYAN